MIAALYVQRGGAYWNLPGVDPWDEGRDARRYDGPWPVVAHPPCSRWCRLAPVNEARYGHRVGDDGGCFAAALASVRKWGGVLEHPAGTYAWAAHGLPRPARCWSQTLAGEWVAEVSQRPYGHPARKLTWLLYVGAQPPPVLDWTDGPPPEAWVSTDRPRAELAALGVRQLGKLEASATPPAFRDLLIQIATSACPPSQGQG